MSDITAMADAYVAIWNETDPSRRRADISRVWVDTGAYRDPLMTSDGLAGIDAMVAGVQGRFPGFVLKRTSKVDSHNNAVRFSWALGPADAPNVVEASISAHLVRRWPIRHDHGLHRQDADWMRDDPKNRQHTKTRGVGPPGLRHVVVATAGPARSVSGRGAAVPCARWVVPSWCGRAGEPDPNVWSAAR